GKGGRFRIAPVGDDVACKQFYWPETNVLITRFLGPHGAAELTDFMPAGRAVSGGKHRLQLIRRVTAVRGILRFRMECRPAFNYARDAHTDICTFWLVEALTRAGRHDRSRLEEARLIFERMLGFANHLGLYAEETGHRGEAPCCVVEAPAAAHGERLGHRDLHVVDVIAVPDWFEQPVCEPKHQDILHRLFPQVVVNAINLVFFQEPE